MRSSDRDDPTAGTAAHPSRQHDPLTLWRTVRLHDIAAVSLAEVRRALSGAVLVHHRAWPAARRGDAAAAIAVTLDLTRGLKPSAAVVDLALSSVLVPAWLGDPAAEAVLAHVLAALPPLRARPGGAGRRRPTRPRPPRR
ncbi:hypothetical protein [Methylobacterium sp. J-070]|uniref:hypothetical protein n=1 Tax=Methylobacterium sp. J-070 TaxID=2836650 RepID=UPI001FBA51C8|nr:hypothetical protein [Methylobacterium sp. J-070]MCJ2054097.1 hypothetical protein [Methylobacterium sp. J-070]